MKSKCCKAEMDIAHDRFGNPYARCLSCLNNVCFIKSSAFSSPRGRRKKVSTAALEAENPTLASIEKTERGVKRDLFERAAKAAIAAVQGVLACHHLYGDTTAYEISCDYARALCAAIDEEFEK